MEHQHEKQVPRILLFAGTTEGRLIARYLQDYRAELYVSVATEYGRMSLAKTAGARILCGRMDASGIADCIREQGISLVIDATHPFAKEATSQIKTACQGTGTEYLRCLREQEAEDDLSGEAIISVESVRAAAEYLRGTRGSILITTGSKELAQYTVIGDYQNRCYARVLPAKESVLESIRLGFFGAHLIAMQGPFGADLNIAMLRHVQAAYFVTKESGRTGGLLEKVKAAKAADAALIVVRAPREEGLGLPEVYDYLCKRLTK